jgi:hypothetical protein
VLLQTSDLLNAAAMTQLAAAEEAELAARAALSQQVAGLEALQAEKAALAQRMQDLQVSVLVLCPVQPKHCQVAFTCQHLQANRVQRFSCLCCCCCCRCCTPAGWH